MYWYCVRVGRLAIVRIFQTVTHGRLNTVKVWAVWQIFCILLALFIQQFIKLRLQTKLSGKLSTSSRWHSENIQSHYQCISFVHHVIDSLHHPPARLWSSSEAWVQWFQWQWIISRRSHYQISKLVRGKVAQGGAISWLAWTSAVQCVCHHHIAR